MAAKKMYLVIQEGGTSLEHYASLYDTKKNAVDAMKGHTKATYKSAGPIEIPDSIREIIIANENSHKGDVSSFESDLLELIENVIDSRCEYV